MQGEQNEKDKSAIEKEETEDNLSYKESSGADDGVQSDNDTCYEMHGGICLISTILGSGRKRAHEEASSAQSIKHTVLLL